MGKLVGVIFLDLKKGFDTVDHDVLLSKLRKYGFGDDAVKWFKNYLKTGKQVT